MYNVKFDDKNIKISLNIEMSRKEFNRILSVVEKMEKPEGDCDAVELISKAAKISPERADEFITITQFMPLDKMMEEQTMAEFGELDSQEIFGM